MTTGTQLDRAARTAAEGGTGVREPDWWYAVLGLVVLAAAAYHVLVLRPGHPWADDFALYILHARNLLEGRPYAATGFVYNPSDPWYSPPAYPPGFPLLLVPIYAAFGADLQVMRLLVIVSLAGVAAAVALLARRHLHPYLCLTLAALVAFQPYFASFTNLLLPDLTFTLFVLLSLLLIARLHAAARTTRRDLALGVLTGACIYFAMSLRIVGLALLVALLLHHGLRLLRRELPGTPVVLAAATALALLALQRTLMPPAYTTQIADIGTAAPELSVLSFPLHRFWNLFAHTDVLWRAPAFAGTAALMSIAALLAAAGYVRRLRAGPDIVESFAVAYCGAIVVSGVGDARYLVPVMPLLLYYALLGAELLARHAGRRGRVVFALVPLVLASYAWGMWTEQSGPFTRGVTGEHATELFAYLAQCTAATDRIVTTRPRALALYTGRSAIRPQQRIDEEGFAEFVRAAGGDHVVAFRGETIAELATAQPSLFLPAMSNAQFMVYRVADGSGSACAPATDSLLSAPPR